MEKEEDWFEKIWGPIIERTKKNMDIGRSKKPLGSRFFDDAPQWMKSGATNIIKAMDSDFVKTVFDSPDSPANRRFMQTFLKDKPDELAHYNRMIEEGGFQNPIDKAIGTGLNVVSQAPTVVGLPSIDQRAMVGAALLTPVTRKAAKNIKTHASNYAHAFGYGMGGTGQAYSTAGRSINSNKIKILRKDLTNYAKQYIKINPEAKPKEIKMSYIKSGGVTEIPGDDLDLIAAGRNKKTNERLFSTKKQSDRIKGRKTNIKDRAKHPTTDAYKALKKEASIENKAWLDNQNKLDMKVPQGHQEIMVEHNISIQGGRKYFEKYGFTGNESSNIFISRNPAARTFKDNIEHFIYPKINKKGKNPIVVYNDKTQKDLIIESVDSGQVLGVIPFGTDRKIWSKQLTQILNATPSELEVLGNTYGLRSNKRWLK